MKSFTVEPRDSYTMRLRQSERRLLAMAAQSRGERLSEYIRTRALDAARRELVRGVERDGPAAA